MTHVSFPLFVAIWNGIQDQTTPQLHFKIAMWLEQAWIQKRTRLLLMAFRSCGKSTLVGLFCAWLLFRQPDIRILVLAADTSLAIKMVRNVKRIIEGNRFTRHLKPDQIDQWASDRFTVRRDKELRDPSMMAKGIAGNMTGSRADIVICDDVEVPNTCDTAEKRRHLRDRLAEIPYVLMTGGTQLFVGTPHTAKTIYKTTGSSKEGFDLAGFNKLKIPIVDRIGQIAMPERYTPEDIEVLKQQSGPALFASQMMLRPTQLSAARLDPELLRTYSKEIDYHEAQGSALLKIDGTIIQSVAAWWDPSFAGQGGDKSVLAIVFGDDQARYYIHRVLYIPRSPQEAADVAQYQCDFVAEKIKTFHLPSLTIETNGIGKFLPGLLRSTLNKRRVQASITEHHNSIPKDRRILEALDAPLAARSIFIHDSVLTTSFLEEMEEWRPGKAGNKDDGMDAVAGAIASLPIRRKEKRYLPEEKPSWRPATKPHLAETNFRV